MEGQPLHRAPGMQQQQQEGLLIGQSVTSDANLSVQAVEGPSCAGSGRSEVSGRGAHPSDAISGSSRPARSSRRRGRGGTPASTRDMSRAEGGGEEMEQQHFTVESLAARLRTIQQPGRAVAAAIRNLYHFDSRCVGGNEGLAQNVTAGGACSGMRATLPHRV